MPQDSTTIAALATIRGSSGIGIIRLSGPLSWEIARKLAPGQPPLVERIANLRRLFHPSSGALLDQGIILPMRGPRSYTGEDTVELQLHGSPLLLDDVLQACFELGARPAQPGEFTFRALLAGKLTLLQAEAVRDLIDAGSGLELTLARHALFHDASLPFRNILDTVTRAAAYLEAPIDFPDQFTDEDEAEGMETARQLALQARHDIAPLLADAAASAQLRQGITVVIAGSPNVGKSSLMNALLHYPRVIVSELPGTTRDTVSEAIVMNGRRVTLVDTAGIGPAPQDALDGMAGERARSALEQADIILLVLDATTGIRPHERELLARLSHVPHLVAVNKVDAGPIPDDINRATPDEPLFGISATEGTELARLTGALALLVEQVSGVSLSRQLVNERQAGELATADTHLADFVAAPPSMPLDACAEMLSEAREALQRILGEGVSPEGLLATVFSTFCIGK
ncbi:MAG: tRNA uridine-5-carboxymethylaminomethyl(34) synthesis GTPase MnmE [Candidatus Cryosericum sp.]